MGTSYWESFKEQNKDMWHFDPKQKTQDFTHIGNDTDSCITSGVQSGAIAELETIISDCKKEKDDLLVLFTGGDTFFFENALKNSIFADQHLVLKGLNIILKYNEDK